MTEPHKHPWLPLSPEAIMSIFQRADFPWWIAGGYAIEHAIGRPLRSHGDIDVLVLRVDQLEVHRLLGDWDCWAADPPGTLRPWKSEETLLAPIADIWCRENPEGPWRLQLMLDEGDRTRWQSRRCPSISKPVNELTSRSRQGIPFLRPEIQLFYKAKAPRDKDEVDFAATLPLLDQAQRTWLTDAITTAYGPENPWLRAIEATFPSLPRHKR